jgi:hypothetical protein
MNTPLLFATIFALSMAGRALADFLPRQEGDSNLVRYSPRCSVYVVSVSSGQWRKFGLVGAPVVEPSMFNQGEGFDVLAIPFDRAGRVTFAPVYIYTVRPESFRLRKTRGLLQGYTSKADVGELMESTPLKRWIRGYEVWFFQFRVRNPFAENPFDSRN